MVEVLYKKFCHDAKVPERAHQTDTGADLFFCEAESGVTVWSGETRICWTGIGIRLPPGWEAQVRGRSSLSSKGMLVAFGSIDEGYLGQIGVTITNTTNDPIIITKGMKIAQLVVQPRHPVVFVEADGLGESDRGAAGFGSSDRRH